MARAIAVLLLLIPLSASADESCDQYQQLGFVERIEALRESVSAMERISDDLRMCLTNAMGLIGADIVGYCRSTNDFEASTQRALAKGMISYCHGEAKTAGLLR